MWNEHIFGSYRFQTTLQPSAEREGEAVYCRFFFLINKETAIILGGILDTTPFEPDGNNHSWYRDKPDACFETLNKFPV